MDPQQRRKLLVILVIAEAITRPVLAGGRHPVKHARDRTQTVIQLACADAKSAQIAGKGYLVIQFVSKLSARATYLDVSTPVILAGMGGVARSELITAVIKAVITDSSAWF